MGKGHDAEFEVQWSTGDVTWAPYRDMKHLQKLDEYFEALGVPGIRQLRAQNGKDITTDAPDTHAATPTAERVIKTSCIRLCVADVIASDTDTTERSCGSSECSYRLEGETHKTDISEGDCAQRSESSTSLTGDMSGVPNNYNTEQGVIWERYAAALQDYGAGRGPHPGFPLAGYRKIFRVSQRFAPVPEDFPPPQQPLHTSNLH